MQTAPERKLTVPKGNQKHHTWQQELDLWGNPVPPEPPAKVPPPKPPDPTMVPIAAPIKPTSHVSDGASEEKKPADSLESASQIEIAATLPQSPAAQDEAAEPQVDEASLEIEPMSPPLEEQHPGHAAVADVPEPEPLPAIEDLPDVQYEAPKTEEIDKVQTMADVDEYVRQPLPLPDPEPEPAEGNTTNLETPIDSGPDAPEPEEPDAPARPFKLNLKTRVPRPSEDPESGIETFVSDVADAPPLPAEPAPEPRPALTTKPRKARPTVATQVPEEDDAGSTTADVVLPGVPLPKKGNADHRWVDTHESQIAELDDETAAEAAAGNWQELLDRGISAGSLLTHARRKIGRSLPEVAAKTHIKADFIRRLELDEFAALPKDSFYAKGWIKKLCALYAIPAEPFNQIIVDWYTKRNYRGKPVPEEADKPMARRASEEDEEDDEGSGSSGRLRLMAVAAVVLAVVALIITASKAMKAEPNAAETLVAASPASPTQLADLVTEQSVLELLPPETLPLTELPAPGQP